MEDVMRKPVRAPARTHHELNVQMKLELIRDAEENPAMTQKDLAKKYGIGKSTVGDILRRQKFRLLGMKMPEFAVNNNASDQADIPISDISSYDDVHAKTEQMSGEEEEEEEGDYVIDHNNEEEGVDFNPEANESMLSDEMHYCPPVKAILREHDGGYRNGEKHRLSPEDSQLRSPRCKRRKYQNECQNGSRPLQPILMAGFDLKHILTPAQLQRCYAALNLPRAPSSSSSSSFQLPVNGVGGGGSSSAANVRPYCESDADDELADEMNERMSESSESETEHSEMSLLEAYELTQHLCNCMKKLLPEGVPHISKCKALMEKSLGLPTTGHQTKISDFFQPSKTCSS